LVFVVIIGTTIWAKLFLTLLAGGIIYSNLSLGYAIRIVKRISGGTGIR
jgi:hypothetical protein